MVHVQHTAAVRGTCEPRSRHPRLDSHLHEAWRLCRSYLSFFSLLLVAQTMCYQRRLIPLSSAQACEGQYLRYGALCEAFVSYAAAHLGSYQSCKQAIPM